MGVIKDQGDAVFRDSVTAGVPASGPNEPAKSEIRSLFSLIDLSLGAAQAGILTAARTIDRDNLYAIEANRDKLIYVNNNNGSSTDPANGVYEYVDGVSRLANGFYRGVTASFQGQIDTVDDKADAATALATTPRPATLADTNRNRVLIADGGYFQGGIADTTGAFQISLPAGVNDARFSVIEIVIMDTNGRYQITVSGSNGASAWDYPVVTFIGSHLLPKPNVRLGRDAANRYCIWIGDTNAGWSYPQVWVKSALFGANVVSELWMGKWNVALVTSFASMQTGPISPVAPLSDVNPSFTGTLNGAQFRSPFFQGGLYVGYEAGINITANSSYNHLFGYQAGKALTTGYNNCAFGLQVLSLATTAQACTGMGTQALQYVTTAQQATAFGIHALLSNTTGFGNCAFGAGAMEYLTTAEQNSAFGTYAGRDNQFSHCDFWGERAGLYGATADYQVWIGSIPDTAGNVDREALIRGDKSARTVRLNGAVSGKGFAPLTDNTSDLGGSGLRFRNIYAATGAITTSDINAKQQIGEIPDEWLDAWEDVQWCRFKYNDAVADKGEDARWHVGLIAQHVREVFAAHGIEAFEIGLCTRSTWDEETAPIMRTVTRTMKRARPLVIDGVAQFEMSKIGELEDKTPVMAPTPKIEEYEEDVEQLEDTGEVEVTREAGEIMGLRYDQAFVLESALNRRNRTTLIASGLAL